MQYTKTEEAQLEKKKTLGMGVLSMFACGLSWSFLCLTPLTARDVLENRN